MDFSAFKQMILCKVQLFMGPEYEVVEQQTVKNNDVTLHGIMAKKDGTNAFPTIYINDVYDENMTPTEVEYAAMKIAKSLSKAELDEELSMDNLMDFNLAKVNVTLKIVNAKMNSDLLSKVPHRRFHDLAVLYRYVVCDDEKFGGGYSVLIDENIQKKWNISEEQLYSIAYENTLMVFPPTIENIKNVLEQMCDCNMGAEEVPMYVLTCQMQSFGSVGILFNDVLAAFAQKIDNDFYILPSSVHELILVPKSDDFNPKDMQSTVREINATQVRAQEVLSDSIYLFDREKGTVEWVR